MARKRNAALAFVLSAVLAFGTIPAPALAEMAFDESQGQVTSSQQKSSEAQGDPEALAEQVAAAAKEMKSALGTEAVPASYVRAAYEVAVRALASEGKLADSVPSTDAAAVATLFQDVKTSTTAAEVFSQLLTSLDVQNVVVRVGEGDAAWNMVFLDGAWYHVDVWAAAQEAKRQTTQAEQQGSKPAEQPDPYAMWLCVSDDQVRALDATRTSWTLADGSPAPAAPSAFVWTQPTTPVEQPTNNSQTSENAATNSETGDGVRQDAAQTNDPQQADSQQGDPQSSAQQPSESTPAANPAPAETPTDSPATIEPRYQSYYDADAANDPAADSPEPEPQDANRKKGDVAAPSDTRMGDEPLGTQGAGSGAAGLKSNLTISSVNVINYTYQVTPIFQGLNYLLYVKTDNPDPASFRLTDKSSRYLVGNHASDVGPYELINMSFIDVKYENPATLRVNGGYLFYDKTGLNDGGELVLQSKTANGDYVDTNVKVACPALKGRHDYLLENVAGNSGSFWNKLEIIDTYLRNNSIYPDNLYDDGTPGSRPYPYLATSYYPEHTLNEYYDMFGRCSDKVLLRYFYPYILDSLDYPNAIGSIAKKLNSNCTVSSGYTHSQVQVSLYGDTMLYDGAGKGGHDPILKSQITQDYRFDGSASDALGETIEQAGARYLALKQKATQAMQPYRNQLSGAQMAQKVGVGSWLRVAVGGGSGFDYSYLVGLPDANDYQVMSNVWVDGRYVNQFEQLQPGVTFDQRPNADIVIRDMEYTDINGKQHRGDVWFEYDSGTDTWKAFRHYRNRSLSGWESDISPELTLTRQQVLALGPDRNTHQPIDSCLLYDGYSEPGTPYTIKKLQSFSIPQTYEMQVGATFRPKVTVTPTDADFVTFSSTSSDETVLEKQSGYLVAKKPGTATVTMRALGLEQTQTCLVTVHTAIESATLPRVKVKVGETTHVTPIIEPADAMQQVTDWQISDTSIATVDQEGNVTGLKSGDTYISCKAANGNTVNGYVKVMRSLDEYEVLPIADRPYTGSEIKPYVTLKDKSGEMYSGYSVTYENNVNVGTATAIITGNEDHYNLTGTKRVTFRIVPSFNFVYSDQYEGGWYGHIFDVEYYARHNPDLADWARLPDGRYDADKLFNHFWNYGMKEGRPSTDEFDVVSYYNANPDLRRQFGSDWEKYYKHFQNGGYYSSRVRTNSKILHGSVDALDGVDWSPAYDMFYYAAHNPDVAKWATRTLAAGTVLDDMALLRHFVNNGTKECRASKEGFDVRSYYNANPDLRAAFGGTADWSKYYRHYVSNGSYEGRKCSGVGELQGTITKVGGTDWSAVYDRAYYGQRNPDIVSWATRKCGSATVLDDYAMLNHFVNNGRKEGRASKATFELASYYNANVDLRRAFGSDWARYYDHYRGNGQREGRRCAGVGQLQGAPTMAESVNWAPVYDVNYYAQRNADVASWATRRFASGSVLDDAALLSHFVGNGTREARASKAGFDVRAYKSKNADLARAFGSDWKSYYRHYAKFGVNEHRACT